MASFEYTGVATRPPRGSGKLGRVVGRVRNFCGRWTMTMGYFGLDWLAVWAEQWKGRMAGGQIGACALPLAARAARREPFPQGAGRGRERVTPSESSESGVCRNVPALLLLLPLPSPPP